MASTTQWNHEVNGKITAHGHRQSFLVTLASSTISIGISLSPHSFFVMKSIVLYLRANTAACVCVCVCEFRLSALHLLSFTMFYSFLFYFGSFIHVRTVDPCILIGSPLISFEERIDAIDFQ